MQTMEWNCFAISTQLLKNGIIKISLGFTIFWFFPGCIRCDTDTHVYYGIKKNLCKKHKTGLCYWMSHTKYCAIQNPAHNLKRGRGKKLPACTDLAILQVYHSLSLSLSLSLAGTVSKIRAMLSRVKVINVETKWPIPIWVFLATGTIVT